MQSHQKKSSERTVLIVLIACLSTFIVLALLVGILFAFRGSSNSNATTPVATTDIPTREATVAPTAEAVQTTTMYVANVENSIYFRGMPVEDSGNIICEIPLGTEVTFISNQDAIFAKIAYQGKEGYVKREYLSSTPPTNTEENTVQYIVYVGNVNYAIYLRSTPSDSSNDNIICEIPLGTPVGFIGQTNQTFSKIHYQGKVGYAKTEYLIWDAPANNIDGDRTAIVSGVAHSIYLRRTASDASLDNVICEIPVGSRVLFIESYDQTWVYISWDGMVGYAKREYLRMES